MTTASVLPPAAPVLPVNVYLDCGHLIRRRDHRWVGASGRSYCEIRCVEAREPSGRERDWRGPKAEKVAA